MLTWCGNIDGDIKQKVGECCPRLIVGHRVTIQDWENLILSWLEENLAEVPIFLNEHASTRNSVHFQTWCNTSYVG